MRRLLLAFLFVFVLLTPAWADYIYTYTANQSASYEYEVSWSFSVPDLLTGGTIIPYSQLTSPSTTNTGHTISQVAIYPVLGGTQDPFPLIQTIFEPIPATYHFAPYWSEPFDAIGTYYNPTYNATLTITSTSVPEPTTLLLLGLGLIGMAGVRKKIKN